MRKKFNRVVRRQLRTFWHGIEKHGPIIPAVLTVIFGVGFALGAAVFIGFNPLLLASWVAATLLIAVSNYYLANQRRTNSILIELTVSYIINGNSRLLDKLLSKLIAGTWRRNEMVPGAALFQILEEEIRRGDFWKRRRIAEALPVLGVIDLRRTKRLIELLRVDWSDRWKADIRRRTVEALYNKISVAAAPLINEFGQRQVRGFLRLREGDQVFTAMAVVEAVASWSNAREKFREQFVEECLEFAHVNYSIEDVEAIEWLQDLLLTDENNRSAAEQLARLREGLESSNPTIKIAAVRNITLTRERTAADTISLIRGVANLIDHADRNIRRPLAKEGTIRFLMDEAASGPNISQARESLEALMLEDPEEIIRITTFDEIEYLIEKNVEYAQTLCSRIASSESNGELKERASRTLSDILSGSEI